MSLAVAVELEGLVRFVELVFGGVQEAFAVRAFIFEFGAREVWFAVGLGVVADFVDEEGDVCEVVGVALGFVRVERVGVVLGSWMVMVFVV